MNVLTICHETTRGQEKIAIPAIKNKTKQIHSKLSSLLPPKSAPAKEIQDSLDQEWLSILGF